jgi:multicomponent Na+:H+ antiporter subunit F
MMAFDLARVAWGFMALLCVPLALAGWRMLHGPTLADRFVAFDMLTAVAVAFSALTAVAIGRSGFFDVALVLSLVSFVATAAFALFLEQRNRH